MSFEFTPVEPESRRRGGGKVGEPNPFTDAVKQIAFKTYTDENAPTPASIGRPITLQTSFDSDSLDDVTRDRNRLRRQASKAGQENTPPCSVYTFFDPKDDAQATPVSVGSGKEKKTVYRSTVKITTGPPQKKRTPKPIENPAAQPAA